MNHWNRRTVSALALCLMLTGCMSRPAEGEYVTLLRDAMVESARIKKQLGQEPRRSEKAVQAVQVWRGTEEK